jgi:protein-tyrosine phosphatase
MLLSLFGKLFSKKDIVDYSVIKTDMHSHLIPGIDDGAKDEQTALLMIEGLKALGFTQLITTPHIMKSYFDNNEQIIQNGQQNFNNKYHTNVVAAAEYFVDESFVEKIKNNMPLLTFGDNYVLIEVSMGVKDKQLEEAIFELTSRNYKPVLAHCERYPYMFENGKLNYYEKLKDADVLLQVNIRSFLGQYGEIQKKIARKLAANDMIDFLGTDIHNELQLPMLKDALQDEYVQHLLNSNQLKNALL